MRKTKKPPRRLAGGFFSVERRVFSEDMQGDAYLRLGWITLLAWANHAESKEKLNGQQVILQRGQLVTGTEELAAELGCSRIVIRRILSYLEETGRISQLISQRGRIITICKYNDYQRRREKSANQSDGEQPTSSQLTANRSATSEQENKRTREPVNNFCDQSPAAPQKLGKALLIEAKKIGHAVYSGIVDDRGRPRFVDRVALDACFEDMLETHGIEVLRRLKAIAMGADEHKVRSRAFDAFHTRQVCAAIARQMTEAKEA